MSLFLAINKLIMSFYTVRDAKHLFPNDNIEGLSYVGSCNGEVYPNLMEVRADAFNKELQICAKLQIAPHIMQDIRGNWWLFIQSDKIKEFKKFI